MEEVMIFLNNLGDDWYPCRSARVNEHSRGFFQVSFARGLPSLTKSGKSQIAVHISYPLEPFPGFQDRDETYAWQVFSTQEPRVEISGKWIRADIETAGNLIRDGELHQSRRSEADGDPNPASENSPQAPGVAPSAHAERITDKGGIMWTMIVRDEEEVFYDTRGRARVHPRLARIAHFEGCLPVRPSSN
jgi:hypothetical protein